MTIPDEILLQVTKPARYIGGETNMVVKNPLDVDIRFGFCFPDVYEVGMSHLGLQILYYFLNERSDTYCERVFSPWPDMEEIMRKNNYGLFALESLEPVSTFDFLGFTLQYEMSYTNIINMLDLAGIPFYSSERDENHPIICAGGPCAYNPEPLADIVDFFYIGEGEVTLGAILDIYKQNKSKEAFLKAITAVEGVYVPKYYDVSYSEDGQISSFEPNVDFAPKSIKKVILSNLENAFYPESQLVPLIDTIHNRVTLEVFRGCMRGCRFCQAGFVYRPVREKNWEELMVQARHLIDNSGHEEISLVSLSTGDYTDFEKLSGGLIEEFAADNVNISLPSLRIDAFTLDLMEKVQKVRKSSLTFAPEAGTQRLRNVINKGITEEEILNGSYMAFEGGWSRVKLYFMIGLPTETEQDLYGIAELSEAIVEKYYQLPKEMRKQPVNVVLSSSCYVPKPFTPFQWEPQDTYEVFMGKQRLLKKRIQKKQIKYNYHDAYLSVLEGVVSRGDRRVGSLIVKAWELGARFDGWSELFKEDAWRKAFEQTGIDMAFYANRKREDDEILPWDHIDIGVSKAYLLKERDLSREEIVTPNCAVQCNNCGAAVFGGGICHDR